MIAQNFDPRLTAAAMVRGLGAFGATAAAFDGARRLLARTEDFRLCGQPFMRDAEGGLTLRDEAGQARFAAAFERALTGGHAACAIFDRASAYPVVAQMRRVSTDVRDAASALVLATLVRVRKRPPQPDPLLLRELFGLTPAEARLASLVAAAAPIALAAERCGVSVKTARTCLERIYGKIGVGRQADLARVLAVAAPPDEARAPAPPIARLTLVRYAAGAA